MYTESWINNYFSVGAFALLLDLPSNIFCHMGDKSEHIKRPLYTSYPSNGLRPLLSSSRKSIRGLVTSTFHGIFRSHQLMIEPNIILLSRCHCVFRYLDAVDSYTRISSLHRTRNCWCFQGVSPAPPVTPLTWIQLGFVSLPLLFPPVHGCFCLR